MIKKNTTETQITQRATEKCFIWFSVLLCTLCASVVNKYRLMKIYHLLIVSILLLSCFACETTEKIDDFPLRPSKLVVNCFFDSDSIWEFQVSKSLSVLDNADIKLINNATIKLFKDSELIETITEQSDDGWYKSVNNLPEIGNDYSIEVTSPDFKSKLFATDYAPVAIPVNNVSITITDSMFWDNYNYDNIMYSTGNIKGNFDITISDPVNTENYYQLSIFSFDTVYKYWDESSEYHITKRELSISSDDPSVENDRDYNSNLIFTDLFFDGKNYKLKVDFEDWNARTEKQYYIELVSFSKSGYLYRKSNDAYDQSQNDPFAEPVMIYCNIENGYGIFSGYSTNIFAAPTW